MKAVRVGYHTFREEYITPEEQFDWGDYQARLSRYALYEAMYNNTVYRNIQRWSLVYKQNYELYKHIRGIYNPAYRLVELIAAKTMGGMIDWGALKGGAIPVTGADERLVDALLQVMRWSKMGQTKTLYARQGAKLGDVGLWVVDEPERQKVRIEVLHPAKIKDIEFDSIGNVVKTCIEYEREWIDEAGRKQSVTYRMDADKERFRTYKDDTPYAWQADARGTPMDEWPNPYGFVPLVKTDFKDLGMKWGGNAFHAGINKINEVNDAASILNDGIRKAADPPWGATGVQTERDIVVPGSLDDGTSTTEHSHQRDDSPILGFPKDSTLTSMAPNIDVAGIAGNIQDLLMELERDYPQLALHRLRESSGDTSGIAIRNAYGDAVGLLQEAMGNLDDGLIRALQMAVSIGGFRRYDGFAGYDLNSYDRGDLDFYIKERPIFEDGFTLDQRVQIIGNLPPNAAAARYILVNELEVTAEDADAIIAGHVSLPVSDNNMVIQSGQRPPQLPAGQGNPAQPGGDDVAVEVNRILSEVGLEVA